ncbi:DUF447 domain-containing protein [Natronobacterium gregoryi]|uniref:DUF447 domain-containing protein n=3 Tax=cellular organisms TaxID=131567 RepID=L0AN31_NATGS|nr:DUF447 domain-containing protein [Natronobacterium gregoryi]AFZ74884.1 hypothetical protein Natgr_3783 [Natronobacterium gregoryi SP2]ELY73302.1 hypothetical protein C490_01807 [Natronobacterium gregoryi SP2]PLK19303.1 DUF447 domain-containing protein [Natronobacterium gregoryi SP2]SFJ53080.1 hypothetical protein SAMN05443661_1376 [Natronobacterium gregoryi]
MTDDPAWPVSLSGVTETVVTTLGPNGLWNAAPLGVFADNPATATTWGRTRTRGNFHRQGEGYVQFVDDPVVFADAALSIDEHDTPILESACAWARVEVESVETGRENGTEWEEWRLEPLESAIEKTTIPTIDRGFGAVVEATVAASRLDVSGYAEAELRDRLEYVASVVDRAGSPREKEALERIRAHSEW